MYNDKLVYTVVIWFFWGIILWKEKEALTDKTSPPILPVITNIDSLNDS